MSETDLASSPRPQVDYGPILALEPAIVGARMLSDTLIADRYRLTEPLGTGGSGTVYRATDVRTGGTVAVKILHPALAQDPEFKARLRREAVLAASLTSPRIVRVTDVGEDAANPFLVMEFVPGPTLQDRLIERGRLPVHEALVIALEVARAMVAAYAGGVLHRDLKPHNIKLPEGQVKVLDFGTARLEGSPGLTTSGVYVGTPEYSAPERGDGEGDIRADVYSLGVILFQMIEGRLPFQGPTPLALLRQQAIAPTPALKWLGAPICTHGWPRPRHDRQQADRATALLSGGGGRGLTSRQSRRRHSTAA